jgi:hypothetical protein
MGFLSPHPWTGIKGGTVQGFPFMARGRVHSFPVWFICYLKQLLVWENEIPKPEWMVPCHKVIDTTVNGRDARPSVSNY